MKVWPSECEPQPRGSSSSGVTANTPCARSVPNRARTTLIGVAAVAWVGGVYSTLTEAEIEANAWVTIVALASAVAALSAVVAANMRVIERLVPRTLVAQLTRRPSKLALAISSLGLVLALVAFIDVFLAGSSPDYRKDAGGYDGDRPAREPTAIHLGTQRTTAICSRVSPL